MSVMLLREARRTSAVVVALAVTAALGARAHAQAVQPTDRPAFGLVGIARGQTARLNVSIGNPGLRPGELPPDPCHVMLGFVDASNQWFMDRSRNPSVGEGDVEPGSSLSFDLHSSDVFRRGDGSRKLLRALVTGSGLNAPPDPINCRGLVSTLELFDSNSGQTSVLYTPTAGGVPPPDPDRPGFGLAGLARGQAAELHVFLNPQLEPTALGLTEAAPTACQVSLAFVDEIGRPFMDRRGVPVAAAGVLGPGGSLSLSLGSFNVVLPGAGRRREIRALVTAYPPDPGITGEGQPPEPNRPSSCQGLVPTLEIVDRESGGASVLYAPTAGWVVPGTPD